MAMHVIVSFLIFFRFSEVFSLNKECGQIKNDKNLSFSWNVGIYLENENQLELVCFGSIIHSKAVLTAAHCFCDNIGSNIRNTSFYIATGNFKKSIDVKSKPSNFHKISKHNIIINKHYKGLTNLYSNDIAIVTNNFQFNDAVAPVCMDFSGFIKDKNPSGKQVVWDKAKFTIADQTYLDSEDCPYEVPKDFVKFVADDKLCTKIKGSSIHLRHESEGGGLFFLNPDDKRWYITGVISMHETSEGKFSTYTTIDQCLNWISNIYASL